jgi:hypothetical protein
MACEITARAIVSLQNKLPMLHTMQIQANKSALVRMFMCVFAFSIATTFLSAHAMAKDPTDALVNIFFHGCLEKMFPYVERGPNGLTAFAPKSGRNFVRDKDQQAWIDTRTLRRVCPPESKSDGPALVNIFFHGCTTPISLPNTAIIAKFWGISRVAEGHRIRNLPMKL